MLCSLVDKRLLKLFPDCPQVEYVSSAHTFDCNAPASFIGCRKRAFRYGLILHGRKGVRFGSVYFPFFGLSWDFFFRNSLFLFLKEPGEKNRTSRMLDVSVCARVLVNVFSIRALEG